MYLVTGASGFVGQALTGETHRRHLPVRSALRKGDVDGAAVVGEIGAATDWSAALAGVDTVFHLAARVHVMQETTANPLTAYREVNVEGTRRLAEQAAAAGVRRLVFMSSIKVNGEHTDGTKHSSPFTAADVPAPVDPYAQSKHEAEQVLGEVAARTGLEVVIVRPPLVYGPGVKGNFPRLARLVRKGWLLPLGAIDNRRSLVSLDNLVDLLLRCAEHPDAAGQTLLVRDREEYSTPGLIREIALAMDVPARLFRMPPAWLRIAGSALGRRHEINRLCDSLQIDDTRTRRLLDWEPPKPAPDAIRTTVRSLA